MVLAFGMLFLCLHSNQVLIQTEMKDGVANPAYVTGAKRMIYAILHDANPTGQAAQLSAMHCFQTVRYIIVDIIWIFITVFVGNYIFSKSDIR